MPSIVINADDFGLTLGVTQGIIACAASEVALSTSAMTCIDEAEPIIRDCAGRFNGGIGLHLQLTQGRPVLPPAQVPSLIAEDGAFPPRRPREDADPAEVAREWRAQVERLRAWGVTPDHLDSHHHVHNRSELLLSVYADLANELRLPVRAGKRQVTHFLQTHGVACPDATVWLSEQPKSVDAIIHALELERAAGPSDLVVELCCHPGFADAELVVRSLPDYVATREHELKLLRDPEFHALLRMLGWETMSFGQLRSRHATGARLS